MRSLWNCFQQANNEWCWRLMWFRRYSWIHTNMTSSTILWYARSSFYTYYFCCFLLYVPIYAGFVYTNERTSWNCCRNGWLIDTAEPLFNIWWERDNKSSNFLGFLQWKCYVVLMNKIELILRWIFWETIIEFVN